MATRWHKWTPMQRRTASTRWKPPCAAGMRTPRPRPPPPNRGCSAQQQLEHLRREAAIGRLQFVRQRPARLPQDRHGLTERDEAIMAVVMAHATGTHTAERQVAAGVLQQRLVDADTAGDGVAEQPLDLGAVVAEMVEGERAIVG